MTKSMTAYGKGDYLHDGKRFLVEMKSLNNRYRDVILRLPKNLQGLEKELRALIDSKIKRGRVEVFFQIETTQEAPPYALELNLPLVDAYLNIFDQLLSRSKLKQELRLETLLQMNDVVTVKTEVENEEEMGKALNRTLSMGLDSLIEMREKEGAAIETDLRKRLERISGFVDEVRGRAPEIVKAYQARLKENVERLCQEVAVDADRIAQEVAIFAERSDITEELVRVASHIQQFETYLEIDDVVGRRLDFLIQEMNREINTLGSKSSDGNVSRIVVEMKAELEKLREQVQNVE
ncbi:MAG: YicC family protein [Deltaproteobacteria bacterium]|nr:YicC family protein [Deltaproteobacteria bacterium]